jgi:hypothetical protein
MELKEIYSNEITNIAGAEMFLFFVMSTPTLGPWLAGTAADAER